MELPEIKKYIKMLESMEEIIGSSKAAKKENLYEKYKKAYAKNDIFKCIMFLLIMGKYDLDNFKKGMLLSNALLNPIGMQFTDKEYRKTMNILTYAYQLIDDDVSDVYKKTLVEFINYTKVLYENKCLNTKRLQESAFFKFPLSQQLRMICIYIQDQSILMYKKLNEKEKRSITGIESELAKYSVDYFPKQQTSLADNYEGILEYTNTLISYIYYAKKRDFELDDIDSHGDIHHFCIPEFEKIFLIAQQRRMYERFEEKFRYSQWNLYKNKKNTEVVYFLKSSNEIKSKVHHTAVVRRNYKIFSSGLVKQLNTNMMSDTALEKLSKKLNADNLQGFHFTKDEYKNASQFGESIAEIAKTMIKPFLFELDFGGLNINDILKTYVYLFTISRIYMAAVMKNFKEDEYSSYKYIVPVVDIEYFTKEISFLFDVSETIAYKMLENFIYNPTMKGCEIFTNPLLMVNKDQVLLCETLFSTYNIERLIDKLLQKHKIDYSEVGKKYEQKIISEFKEVEEINVNTNKIQFMAYDGKDIEFDFLATFDDCLLLIELKSLTVPYSDKELRSREKVILEGVDQVNRRVEVIKHDWEKICSQASIELPERPYEESKIIKIVCTDIYDFTTLKYKGVTVIDDISLLKYFSPIGVFKTHIVSGIVQEIEIVPQQKLGKPTMREFKEYLNNPVTVEHIPNCLKQNSKPIPRFKEDNAMVIIEYILSEDPYEKQIQNKAVQRINKKIGRNTKCPCGSGKKYKNCCGK